MATYRHIHVRFLVPNGTMGAGVYFAIAELALLNGTTPIDLSGATITAQTNAGSVIGTTANIIDGNTATYLAFTEHVDAYCRITIDTGSEQSITALRIRLHDAISGSDVYGIDTMAVWGGIGATFDIDASDQLVNASAISAWSIGEQRDFPFNGTGVSTFRYYRLLIETAHGSGDYFGALNEVEFAWDVDPETFLTLYRSSAGSRAITTTGPESAPSPLLLFDADTYSDAYHWGDVSGPQSITVDFGGPISVNRVTLYLRHVSDAYLARSPDTGRIEASNDGSTWHTLATFDLPTPVEGASHDIALSYVEDAPPTDVEIEAPIAIAAAALCWQDFSALIDWARPMLYVMDVIDVLGNRTRIPISSWQATLQIGAASYVQAAVPAAEPHLEAIDDAFTFVISAHGLMLDGSRFEIEQARAPAQTKSVSGGPYRTTATISGYAIAFASFAFAPQRALISERTFSITGGSTRVRCALDLFMRPGFAAISQSVGTFTARFINYYVTTDGDTFMDVGSSSDGVA